MATSSNIQTSERDLKHALEQWNDGPMFDANKPIEEWLNDVEGGCKERSVPENGWYEIARHFMGHVEKARFGKLEEVIRTNEPTYRWTWESFKAAMLKILWTTGCSTCVQKAAPQTTHPEQLSAVIAHTDTLWDNGETITCCFVDPSGTAAQQKKVKDVVEIWKEFVNIRFEFVTDSDANIRIAFDKNVGTHSCIGKMATAIPSPEPTMNLGVVHDYYDLLENEKGVILHEFGHALGFHHEHQSPRCAEEITFIKEAVVDWFKTQYGWNGQNVKAQVLGVFKADELSGFSAVDTTSIMIYRMPGNLNREGIEIPLNNQLSELDKAYATISYPPPCLKTIKDALNVAGIHNSSRHKILEYHKQNDWDGVRDAFATWSQSGQAVASANLTRKRRHHRWLRFLQHKCYV